VTGDPRLRLIVSRRATAADGVVVLDLRDPGGADLPDWAPGAHIDLVPVEGLVRQYSLCGDPADRAVWRIAVLREPAGRGGSRAVHDQVGEGDLVEVAGPRNHFPLVPAPRYLFLAGGIGITPLLPMVAAATAAGAGWRLHYGGRSRASMAFREALCSAYGARVLVHPQDETGLLDLDAILADVPSDTPVYCCGPEPLLQAVERRCIDRPLHVERFTPKEQGEPVRSDSFEVSLARAGRTLTVPPGKSILRVVEEAGIELLWSCTEGTCGTCETAVLAGQVDHRDSLLTDEERAANDTMLICVSRAAGPRLILDI
jgi:ferredoxin-NADP reductase